MHHLVERWGNKATQSHDVDLLSLCSLDDLLGWDHYTKVDDLVIVTCQHNTNDVLADIVYVALHRCHQYSGSRFTKTSVQFLFFFEEWHQVRYRFLHHAGALHHLRKEHLTGAKQIANYIH